MSSDISFTIEDDSTEGGVATIEIVIGGRTLRIMGEPVEVGSGLLVRGVHVDSMIGPNGLGFSALRRIARVVMTEMGYDEIVVQGQARTTGAYPGHRPRLIRFTRGDPS